jgi:hypothetical protein
MRAILLARATAASLHGLRSSKASSQAEAVLLPGLAYRITAVAPSTRCRLDPYPDPGAAILAAQAPPRLSGPAGMKAPRAGQAAAAIRAAADRNPAPAEVHQRQAVRVMSGLCFETHV